MTFAEEAIYRYAMSIMTDGEKTVATAFASRADAGDRRALEAFESIVHRVIQRERIAAAERHRIWPKNGKHR